MLITRTWYLEVNGIPLATPAWEIPNLDEQFNSLGVRGSDTPLPGGNTVPNPRRPAVTVFTFPLDVNGNLTSDGEPTSDGLEGLAGHFDYLEPALGYGKTTDGGVVVIIYHRGSLAPKTASGHFLGFKGSSKLGIANEARTTFDLSVLDPGFVVDGS